MITPNAEGEDREASPTRAKNALSFDSDPDSPGRVRRLIGKASPMPLDTPLFAAYPARVQFTEYRAFEPVIIVVRLRNHDNVARRVRVVPPESTWFSISPFLNSGRRASKVAPGIEVKFRVTFTAADEHTEYWCRVVVITERERFEVAVEALGRPARLQFPDAIRFDAVPANHVTMQPHLLRNVGRTEVAWEMRLSSASVFGVVPAQGVLTPGQHAQVQVEISAGAALGDVHAQLELVFDKGRQRHIVQDVEISLDADQVDLPPACIHLCTVANLRLFNDSDIPVTYTWMRSALGPIPVDTVCEDHAVALARFDDEHFAIEPPHGELYPGGFIEFTVSFRPSASDTYTAWAYCLVGGRSQRLPLRLTGRGIGPTALFSFDTLDVGDVYVNAVYRYDVVLKNVSQIQARFALAPEGRASSRFRCGPSSGVLESGQATTIAIAFSSTVLGAFQEVLCWTLYGSVTPITLSLSGNVVAPAFVADVTRLDFGVVAYGFVTTRSFHLRNTSEIPVRFLLRCPQDGKFLQREIDIRPAVVAVLPHATTRIDVDMCSETVQCYNLHTICVDIENVGADLLRIPLDADCQVPEIEFGAVTADFGRCYLRYAYGQVLELSNPTDLPVRFEIVTDLTAYRLGQGRIQFDTECGTVLPHSTYPLKVTFFAESLGEIEIGVYVRTCGSSAAPFQIGVHGVGMGARLLLSRTVLDYRHVPVLHVVDQHFTIRNDTPIEARFVAFAARRYSPYVAVPRQGVLAPGQSVEITVRLTCNDNAVFRDVIHVLVEDGDAAQVQCRAQAVGSMITCTSPNIDCIDLGPQITVQTVTRTFTLRNDGVRAQTLTWRCESGANTAAFQIHPDRVVLAPMQSVQVVVEGRSAVPRVVDDSWTCLGLYVNEKEPHVVARTRLQVVFADPHVEFSVSEIRFEYRHQIGVTVASLSKSAVLRNPTPLTLPLVIGVKHPFTVDRRDVTLSPGQEVVVDVLLPLDAVPAPPISELLHGQLIVAFLNHPARDRIPISAQLWYPNLTWSQTDVQYGRFGTIVTNTMAVRRVQATNTTVLPVDFSWTFVTDSVPHMNQEFDIEPLFGRIAPGASRTFLFSFFGWPARSEPARIHADCAVLGGPNYLLTLQGDADQVQYGLALGPDDTVDFGAVEFHTVHERDVVVANQGRVKFEVRILIPPEFEPLLAVRSTRFTVEPKTTQRLRIRFVPRRPQSVRAHLQLFVGAFPPRTVSVTGIGTCALITATLPGAEPDLRVSLLRTLDQYDRTAVFSPVDSALLRVPLQTCVLDLGDVVRSTSRKASFEVVNVGDVTVTLDVDKSATNSAAQFRLDPPRHPGLAPAQSGRFTVTYGGGVARKTEALGDVRTTVQIGVGDGTVIGPPLAVVLRACVLIPDLAFSSDSVDFGPVYFGYRVHRYVRLTNTTRVQCDWSLSAVKGRTFSVVPKSGSLAPGAQIDLVVAFTPTSVREQSATVTVQIQMNSRDDLALTLRGRGQLMRVRFDPPKLEFFPLPAAAPGTTAPAPPRTVRIINDTDCPIHLFSVDFDERYLLDEETARSSGRFDAAGVMLVEPVVPGAPIAELTASSSSISATEAPDSRHWKQVVILGTVPGSDAVVADTAAQFALIVVNVDRVVDHYAQTQLDSKLVAAEKRKKKPADTGTEFTSLALAIAVQDAMSSGQPAYVTPDLLHHLLIDYCYIRDQAVLAPDSCVGAGGVLLDVTRCKVVVGGPRAAYAAAAGVLDRAGAVPDGRRVRTYVIAFGTDTLDSDAAGAFRVDTCLDVGTRVRADRQAVAYGDAPDCDEGSEPLALRVACALRDQLDQRERALVLARIPPPHLLQILRRPVPRSLPGPSGFYLADPQHARWVIPAQSQVAIQIGVAGGDRIGPIHADLAFELAHDPSRRFTLPCSAMIDALIDRSGGVQPGGSVPTSAPTSSQ